MPTHGPRTLRAAVGALVGKSPAQTAAAVEAARKAGADFPSESIFAAAETIGLLAVVLAGSDTIEAAAGAYMRLAHLLPDSGEERPPLADFVQASLASAWMRRAGLLKRGHLIVEMRLSRTEATGSAVVEFFDGEADVPAPALINFGEPSRAGFERGVVLRRPVLDALADLLASTDVMSLAAGAAKRREGGVS